MNIAEARKIGRKILEQVCDDALEMTGEHPHIEEQGNRMIIVWPDGEVTNELEIQDLRTNQN